MNLQGHAKGRDNRLVLSLEGSEGESKPKEEVHHRKGLEISWKRVKERSTHQVESLEREVQYLGTL